LKSSVIVTGAGLLFVNAADRKVHVYDSETGKPLHELWLGATSSGSPSMYEWQGRQYLLVTAGPGTRIGGRGLSADPSQAGPDGLIAYALPE
jgi:quinoprotein glucose dehydrogenase